MTELWLKFKDERGETRRVLVRGEKFTIGRQAENDLYIPISQLSRRHAEIDRFGDVYVIADNNSSNGTTLNGQFLQRPTAVENGDKINLGGGLEIEVELISAVSEPVKAPAEPASGEDVFEKADAPIENAPETPEINAAPPPVPANNSQKTAAAKSSNFGILFIIAPVLVIVILVFAGGLLLLFGGKKKEIAQTNKDTYDYSEEDEKPSKNKKSENSKESPTPSSKSTSNSSDSSPTPEVKETQTTSSPQGSSERDKIEANAYSFLRRIAKAESNPFLTTRQIELVNGKIKSFKGSSALQGNLQDLKKKSAEIETLAKSKALRPQFLATAALAQLGNKRGDVLATAQNMASALNQLTNLISNDLSSDSLLIIAAYQENAGGESKMPGMLANLTGKFPNQSPQAIRTIWFLREQNKINEAQFDFALQFLAIGTITQNPKDFSINTEAVIFN